MVDILISNSSSSSVFYSTNQKKESRRCLVPDFVVPKPSLTAIHGKRDKLHCEAVAAACKLSSLLFHNSIKGRNIIIPE